MEEFAKKKGKEMTRGPKLIAKENAETIHFYRNMILGKSKEVQTKAIYWYFS